MYIKVIERLGVTGVRPPDAHDNTEIDCGPTRRISIANQGSDLASWQRAGELSALIANASQSLTGFSDLASTAVGETTGEGLTAQITLDTNAAGHNWYIDPTPLDNTDDYLPTSDATVWKAKAGSDAEDKMDMLRTRVKIS